jgi:hypothetical protein
MSRPLSLFLAAALAAGSLAMSVPSAVAQSHAGIQLVGDSHRDWDDGWATNWRDDRRYWRHDRRHWRHERPGFSFNIGVPFPRVFYRHERPRDCYREWDGSLYCRAF